jgi:hypothetical protein
MAMAVPRSSGNRLIVFMLMMRIVTVHMVVFVFERLMNMVVFVPLREMQIYADRHQRRRSDELRSQGVSHEQGEHCAEKGSHGEIRAVRAVPR